MSIGRGYSKKDYEDAMHRLLDLGTIKANERVFQYPNRNWATGLAIVGEGAQSLAQSVHKTLHKGSTKADGG